MKIDTYQLEQWERGKFSYGQYQGEFCENISLYYGREYKKPENTGKRFRIKHPDGVFVDNGFSKALEIKYYGGTVAIPTLDRLIECSNNQLRDYDYRVLHIHTLRTTIKRERFINRLRNRSIADLVVIFFGGEPVKTMFLPRK